MTLAEAKWIFDYWADNPPVHLMVQVIARMLGWKSQQPGTSSGLPASLSSDAVDPQSLALSGVLMPASPELAAEFSALARLASPSAGVH